MSQTRLESAVEAVVGTTIGFIFGVLTQVIVFPWFDMEVTFGENMLICAIFTAVSLVRGYIVRRWFETQLDNFKVVLVRRLK